LKFIDSDKIIELIKYMKNMLKNDCLYNVKTKRKV